MKLTRRILALTLCLTMVLAMAIPAFAAEHTHTITINQSREGYEYYAYQIFDGELDRTGALSNITWGADIDGTALLAALKAEMSTVFGDEKVNSAIAVATKLAEHDADDNDVARQFAEIAARFVSGGTKFAQSGSKYTATVNSDGYYLVVNTKVPEGTDTHFSRYILEVVADVEVKHKGDYPKIDKKINEDGNLVELNEASIGDEINYVVTGTMPSYITDYDAYFYRFEDTLSKGLTYKKGSLKVYIGTGSDMSAYTDVTKYFYNNNPEYVADTETKFIVAIENLLALENVSGIAPITADTKIVLNYTAILNEYAVIGGTTGNPNVVDLEYSNNPNDCGEGTTNPPPENPPEEPKTDKPTGETPDEVVTTFTTEIALQKTDGTGALLTGAEFELTGTGVKTVLVEYGEYEFVGEGAGEYYLLVDNTYTKTAPNSLTEAHYVTGTADYNLVTKTKIVETSESVKAKAFVDATGKLTFTGLGAGTYTLTETTTPEGFNTCDPINFTITFDTKNKTFVKDTTSSVMFDATTNTYHVTVKNVSGSKLPSTGGMGTTLFYAFGSVMFIGAAVLLITKKRMSA